MNKLSDFLYSPYLLDFSEHNGMRKFLWSTISFSSNYLKNFLTQLASWRQKPVWQANTFQSLLPECYNIKTCNMNTTTTLLRTKRLWPHHFFKHCCGVKSEVLKNSLNRVSSVPLTFWPFCAFVLMANLLLATATVFVKDCKLIRYFM